MTDFSKTQKDYAVYLPAVSAVYSNHIGEQRHREFVKKDRLPFPVEKLNFLNKKEGAFYYPWCLYSAGHAKIKLNEDGTHPNSEDMWVTRDKAVTVLADSGGFQIAKGVWKANWDDVNDPKAKFYRETVLSWMERTSEYGMTLDVPTWGENMTYNYAIKGTRINNDYFVNNPGQCKILNVLQGDKDHENNAATWYNGVKDYCDPKKHDNPFRGWSLAGSNARCLRQILLRLLDIAHDDLLRSGTHDWVHILGYSTMDWAIMATCVQRALRKHVNPTVTVSYDSASPYIQTSKASVYSYTQIVDGGKWAFAGRDSWDDKKYSYRGGNPMANDPWIGAKDPIGWETSPIADMLKMGDICWYADGEANRQGKVGKSSWDTYSYILQMGHNTHHHIKATQEANMAADKGMMPKKLLDNGFQGAILNDIIDSVFKQESKAKALDILEQNKSFIRQIEDRNFAPKNISTGHISLDGQDNLNKLKEFKTDMTRKQYAKTSTINEWFD